MPTEAGSTAWSVSGEDRVVSQTRGPPAAPDTLIRTMGGHITGWSPGMQQRYGFTSTEACGTISHRLLRTIFPQTLQAIETTLADQQAWHGGLIHHHADGTPRLAVNHWYVHQGVDHHARLVTEVHSNIAPDDQDIRHQVADLLAVLAHELSEPLTAITSYVAGVRLLLGDDGPDLARLRLAMVEASGQLARGADGVTLLRELACRLRDTA